MNTIAIIIFVAVFAFILYKGYESVTKKYPKSTGTGGGGVTYNPPTERDPKRDLEVEQEQ